MEWILQTNNFFKEYSGAANHTLHHHHTHEYRVMVSSIAFPTFSLKVIFTLGYMNTHKYNVNFGIALITYNACILRSVWVKITFNASTAPFSGSDFQCVQHLFVSGDFLWTHDMLKINDNRGIYGTGYLQCLHYSIHPLKSFPAK